MLFSLEEKYEEAHSKSSWSSSSRGDESIDYDPDGPDSECDWNDEDEWSFEGATAGEAKEWPGKWLKGHELREKGLMPEWLINKLQPDLEIRRMSGSEMKQKRQERQRAAEQLRSIPPNVVIRRMSASEVKQIRQRKESSLAGRAR